MPGAKRRRPHERILRPAPGELLATLPVANTVGVWIAQVWRRTEASTCRRPAHRTRACRRRLGYSGKASRLVGEDLVVVEVPGIEPGSFGAEPGLLRAQPTCAFLGPSSHAGKLLTGPVAVRFPARSRDRTERLSLLADARHRAEGTPGLTACSLLLRQRERRRADWNRRLLVCWAWFSRSSQPSSARFPWLDYRSRDHSPPVQLCLHRTRSWRPAATRNPSETARGTRCMSGAPWVGTDG